MKLLVYPSSKEVSAFARYGDQLKDCEEVLFTAPKGWARDGGDFLELDGGAPTGKTITTDFEKALGHADAVYFPEGPIPLPPQFLADKMQQALRCGKKVFADKLPEGLEGQPGLERVAVLRGEPYESERKAGDTPPVVCAIPVPVVFVMGMGPNTNKFEVQIALRKYFQQKGYSVSQVGTKRASCFFGFESFPECFRDDRLGIRNKIIALNRYFYQKYLREKPEVMIIGVPGGIMPLNPLKYEDMGEMALLISQAVRPDIAVLCTYAHEYTQQYFDELRLLCRYKLDFNLKFVAVSGTDTNLSQDSQTSEFVTIPLELARRQFLAEEYRGIELFSILDAQDMDRLGAAVLDHLAHNL